MEVRIFHGRMTLLHISAVAGASTMVLVFRAGPNITHVLSSSQAAPKTLFDFDQVHTNVQQQVFIRVRGGSSLWCAIFGAADGYSTIAAYTRNDVPSAGGWWLGLGSGRDAAGSGNVFVYVLWFLCGLPLCWISYCCAQKT